MSDGFPSFRDIDTDAVAFAVARNQCGEKLPLTTFLLDVGLTEDEFARLLDNTLFQRKVRDYVKELVENGVSFQMKARIQAENLLKRHYRIASSQETPPSVALKAIENTVRWAGLERKVTETPGEGGPKIAININLGDPAAGTPTTHTITVDPTPLPPDAPAT